MSSASVGSTPSAARKRQRKWSTSVGMAPRAGYTTVPRLEIILSRSTVPAVTTSSDAPSSSGVRSHSTKTSMPTTARVSAFRGESLMAGITSRPLDGLSDATPAVSPRRSITASANAVVDTGSLPGTSRVSIPAARAASTARSTRLASSSRPACRSSMAPDRITAHGLAVSVPAYLGADPWTASKIATSAPRLADGAKPSPPTSPR